MELIVIGHPTLSAIDRKQYILAQYDATRETTTINCDVDIVTLGLAVNILTEQYEQCLGHLELKMASEIRDTTRKVVSKHAEYRSENIESSGSLRSRTNDGSDGKTNAAWRENFKHGRS